MGLIEEFHQEELNSRTHHLVGSATLTVTRLSAGIADNIVPDRCELLLDRRLVPGETEENAKKEIENVLLTAKSEFSVRSEIIDRFNVND